MTQTRAAEFPAQRGWTLVFNISYNDFDASDEEESDKVCFEDNCINRSYSTVPIESAIRIDVGDDDIEGSDEQMRVVIDPANDDVLDETFHELMNKGGPHYLDDDDNDNIDEV